LAKIKPLKPAFKGDNKRAQSVAEKQAARMVTEITKETRAALRALVARSIREGIPPYNAARAIRDMVGLTTRQSQAAMNYRRGLIESGLTLEKVDRLTEKYAAKKLRERSENIARTEIMGALNKGSKEATRQAEADGLLDDKATKTWIITPDDRLCDQCEPLDDMTIPLNADFPQGDPPLHPQCRCIVAVNP
jgi:hypothetical protein